MQDTGKMEGALREIQCCEGNLQSLQAHGSSTVADMLCAQLSGMCNKRYCEFPMSINSDFRDDIEYINLARKPKPYINLKPGAFIEQIFWLKLFKLCSLSGGLSIR